MFAEPVRASRTCANRSANQNSRRSANQAADQHSAQGPAASFFLIVTVVAGALELALFVYVGSVAKVGVDQRGIQKKPLAAWQNEGLGEDSDCACDGDAPRFVHLGHDGL